MLYFFCYEKCHIVTRKLQTKTIMCFIALLTVQAVLPIWKEDRQNTGNVNLLACSNYFFIKIFCFCNHLEVKSIPHYISLYINHLLTLHNNFIGSESSNLICNFEQLLEISYSSGCSCPTLKFCGKEGDDSQLNDLFLWSLHQSLLLLLQLPSIIIHASAPQIL